MTRAELVRKTIIRMARQRQRPGSGSSLEFLTTRTAKVEWPDLPGVLGEIPMAVIGVVATRHYMPERSTQDLDVVVAVQDAVAARTKLQTAGWKYVGDLSAGKSTWQSPAGVNVDVVEGREPWWTAAIAEARGNRDLQGLPVLPLRYLVLMKFRSGRTQDIADVSRMLGQAHPEEIEVVRQLFAAEEPGGLEDLESLVLLGQLEMQPDAPWPRSEDGEHPHHGPP